MLTRMANLFLSYRGRITRLQFWLANIALVVVNGALEWLFGIPIMGDPATWQGRIIDFAIGLILLYPRMAIAVQRLHDLNRPASQVWLLVGVFLIALVGNLFGYFDVDRPQTVASTIILAIAGILALAYLIYLGFRSGTPGDNSYGPAPSNR